MEWRDIQYMFWEEPTVIDENVLNQNPVLKTRVRALKFSLNTKIVFKKIIDYWKCCHWIMSTLGEPMTKCPFFSIQLHNPRLHLEIKLVHRR